MKSNDYTPVIKKTLPLRFSMSYLKTAIGDCSQEVKKCIDDVYKEIEKLESEDD